MHSSRSRFVAVVALALLWLAARPAGAQESLDAEAFAARVAQWQFTLDQADAEARKRGVSPGLVAALRPDIERVQTEAAAVREASAARLKTLNGLLAALGPPPAATEPSEDPAVAARREELRGQIAAEQGRIQQADITITAAQQIVQAMTERRRTEIARSLTERGPSPISWGVITGVGPHFVQVLGQLAQAPIEAWAPVLAGKVPVAHPWLVPVMPLLVLGLGWPARRWLLRRFVRDDRVHRPSYARRLVAAIAVAFARGVIPAALAAAPLAAMLVEDARRGIVGDMLVAGLGGAAFVLLVGGIARAALAPASVVTWRLAPLTDASARRLHRRLMRIAIIGAVLNFIEYPATRHLSIPEDLRVFYDFVGHSVLAVFVLALLSRRLWQSTATPTAGTDAGSLATLLRMAVGAIAIGIPVASVLGYNALAGYLTDNLYVSGLVIGAWVVLHGLARDAIVIAFQRGAAGEEDGSAPTLRFWVVASVDLGLLVGGIATLVGIWGMGWSEFDRLWGMLSAGIRIGSLRLSIPDVVYAIALFVIVVVATRGIQRVLESRIFPQTRLDAGVRHSLKTALGYLGLVTAVAVAVAALGLDLSNVALIAGALSVGIGFGLQNVVNNFVSGLILLLERPIKVGDWVVVGSHEGYVRRISVRATEVETFQRAAVIIPNSEIISTSVTNWTHRDTFARVDVPVGAAYGSDPDRVREVLLECAHAHPGVLDAPEPYVLLLGFGDSALEFQLRFFIADADASLRTGSEMRFAIVGAFRAAGIGIPFPQRDLWLRSTPPPSGEPPPRSGGEGDEGAIADEPAPQPT